MINNGIYTDLSSESYHADKYSISRTSIMDFKKSPRNYWAKHINPKCLIEPKESCMIGHAFHTLVLEHHLFHKNYAILPASVLLRDVGREEYDRVNKSRKEIQNNNKIILKEEVYQLIEEMNLALHENLKAKDLIYGGVNESSYFWIDSESGLTVKARPDILHENIFVDLKTCNDASPEAFQRDIVKYGNYIQAAMVSDGVYALTGNRLSACINICVEKSYPYSIGIYIIDELAIDQGAFEYKKILMEMKECFETNEWKDYAPACIGLPRWYL